MGSAGSVLKVKGGVRDGGGGSALLADQRTERRRAAIRSQSEESQRDWGVTGSLQGLWLYNQTPKGCLQH